MVGRPTGHCSHSKHDKHRLLLASSQSSYDKQFNDQFSMNTSTQRSQRTEQSRQPETPIMRGELKTIVEKLIGVHSGILFRGK